MTSDWEYLPLGDAISINPTRVLKKGAVAKSVSMANIDAYDKQIHAFEVKEYKGGTKFKNGDTLMARITPCLENGKTSFVDLLDENEVAFGSTEFLILTGKKGKSLNDFVYYLAISPELKKVAIQSMVGSSGRQRVQTDLLAGTKIQLPPLPEQQAIAEILSSLDDKIELNRKMNKTLEDIGRALFKRWFVDFEFPNENDEPYKSNGGEMVDSELGEIPKGWQAGKYGDLVEVFTGKGLTKDNYDENGIYPVVGANGELGRTNNYLYDERLILTGRVGTLGTVYISNGKVWISDNVLISRAKSDETFYYAYFSLKRTDFQGLNRGSTQPLITQTDIKNIGLVLPETKKLNLWHAVISTIFNKIYLNKSEIENLSLVRDSLLPRLMNGKIRVPLNN